MILRPGGRFEDVAVVAGEFSIRKDAVDGAVRLLQLTSAAVRKR
jgi:hypothetical protein